MAKTKAKAKPKLELNQVLSNIVSKNRNFYDELADDERKGFSPFLLIRYASSAENYQVPELAEYVLQATNRRVNPHFFDLKTHPKLQWLLLTTTSPGFGGMRHNWIKPLGAKKTTNDRIKKFLSQEFPNANSLELDILATINSQEDIADYAASSGYQIEEIEDIG